MPVLDETDPFSIDHLILVSALHHNAYQGDLRWFGFQFNADAQSNTLSLDDVDESRLPSLKAQVLKLDAIDSSLLSHESLDLPTAKSNVNNTSVAEQTNQHLLDAEQEGAGDDVWKQTNLSTACHENRLVSWDHFGSSTHVEPQPVFISEAGLSTFDALLRKYLSRTHEEDVKYASQEALLHSLFDVGIGRSSIVFDWNPQSLRFEATCPNFTISGLSRDLLQALVNQFLDSGARFKRLRQFGQGRRNWSPALVALRTAINSIVDLVEESIESTRNDIRTLVQLQEVYAIPFRILNALDDLMRKIRNISKDEDMVTVVLDFTDRIVSVQPQLEHIICTIILQISRPALSYIEAEIGLTSHRYTDYNWDAVVSAMLPTPTYEMYTQIKTTFRVLQSHSIDCPVVHARENPRQPLEVKYSLGELVEVEELANLYEKSSQAWVLTQHKPFSENIIDSQPRDLDRSDSAVDGNPFAIDFELLHNQLQPEKGTILLLSRLDDNSKDRILASLRSLSSGAPDTLPSCHQAIDLSVRPWLRAQHRLLSYACMRILFQEHDFVSHTKLLNRFLLLTDGLFVTNLTQSLFSASQLSEQTTTQRELQTTAGLRLQSRETWPPATSELRLALMGILSDCTFDIQNSTLTDSISFAIRDLSDEDLERCRDISSIHALDFLKLNYKPPSSIISTIITRSILTKYDQVFNQLLRLLRMQALTQTLLHRHHATTNRNFLIQAHHLTTTLSSHYQTSIVPTAFTPFTTTLAQITTHLNNTSYTATLNLVPNGLDTLRTMHESSLDTITSGLFLRQKQGEAKGIIDRLFEVILRFAREGDAETVDRLHADFEVHMKALVRWLSVEAGREGDGAGLCEMLLVRLDWNGFWSR